MTWSNLQIATLAVSALTPITVATLGIFVARAGHRIEQVQWANQTVVTRRLEIFGQLAPGLNRLLCFAIFVGSWKELQPQQIVAIKRQLDEMIYANKLLFSNPLFEAYHDFANALFEMYATVDGDALLRVQVKSQWGDRRNMPWWNESMAQMFSSNVSEISEVQAAYDNLSQQFRADLYVTEQGHPLLGG